MDIFKETFKLAEKIQATDEYIKLEEAKKKNDDDEKLQGLINEFNMLKIKLQHGKANEEEIVAENSSKLNKIYDEIMNNENMTAFNEASEKMNFLMNKINKILIAAVNGQDFKNLNLNDLTTDDCGGNCSNCHGCS